MIVTEAGVTAGHSPVGRSRAFRIEGNGSDVLDGSGNPGRPTDGAVGHCGRDIHPTPLKSVQCRVPLVAGLGDRAPLPIATGLDPPGDPAVRLGLFPAIVIRAARLRPLDHAQFGTHVPLRALASCLAYSSASAVAPPGKTGSLRSCRPGTAIALRWTAANGRLENRYGGPGGSA